jgi:tetratricopeptide (TPR) repeat protein
MAAQSVAYIVQRMNSLAVMFYMLSLLSYVYGRIATDNRRRTLWFLASIVSGLLSLGSKEIAVTLPFFIVLYEWYFFQDLKLSFLKRWPLLVCVILVVTAFVILLPSAGDFFAGYDRRPFTLGERVLTQFRVVVFYISLLLFPHPSRLTVNHDFPLSHGLFDPVTTLLSITFVIGLLMLATYTAKKERLISFCILWYLGQLVIESSIIPLELVFEHRTYLPSIGLFLLLVAQFYRYTPKGNLQLLPLGIMVIVFSFWSHERSAVWADSIAFWTDTVNKTPQVARLYNNLGVAHEERGDLDEALVNYTRAFSLDGGLYRAMNNIGLIHLEKKNFEEALRAFNESKEINPYDIDAYKGLALTYQAMNDRARYMEFLEQVQEMEKR